MFPPLLVGSAVWLKLLLLLSTTVVLLHAVAAKLLLLVCAIAPPVTTISLVVLLVLAAVLLVALLPATILPIALSSAVALTEVDIAAHLSGRARHDIFVRLLRAASHGICRCCIVLMAHHGAGAQLACVPSWQIMAMCVAVFVLFISFDEVKIVASAAAITNIMWALETADAHLTRQANPVV